MFIKRTSVEPKIKIELLEIILLLAKKDFALMYRLKIIFSLLLHLKFDIIKMIL